MARQNQEFAHTFLKEPRLDQIYGLTHQFKISPIAQIFRSTYLDLMQVRKRILSESEQKPITNEILSHIKARLQRVMERSMNQQYASVELRLSILATISSSAPFVGLFGTVLGIIDSFQNIGVTGATSLASVAPGISEALVATAAGLLAAIPALIAYNYYRNYSRRLGNNMKEFSLELTNRIEWAVHEHFTISGS